MCSEENAEKYCDAINATMEKYEINTPLRQAHFLAQVGHESDSLIYNEEIASGAAYENRADLGNTLIGDGKRYKGRGLIQITGRANYRMYGDFEKMDFESNPELLAELPYCVDSAGWFWDGHSLNILADQDKSMEITRRINGGTNGLIDRLNRLTICKKVLLSTANNIT
jgi:putative chitinase